MGKQQKNRPSFFTPEPQTYPLAPQPVPAYAPGGLVAQQAVPRSFDVHVTVLTDSHATVAEATLNDPASPYGATLRRATGSSRRANDDEYDPEIGTLYAMERALRNLAGQMRRAADAQVRSADSVRAHREQSRRAKQEKAQETAQETAHEHEQETGSKNLSEFLTAAYAAGIPRDLLDAIWDEHKNHGHGNVSVRIVGAGNMPLEIQELLRAHFPDVDIRDDGTVSLSTGDLGPDTIGPGPFDAKIYGKGGRHRKDVPGSDGEESAGSPGGDRR